MSVDSNSKQIFALMNHNQQDPRYMGTVVFRGSPFPKKCQLGMNEVSLVMAAYPKSFSQYRTSNQGTFHMVKMRQSSMSSRSMGVVSNSVEHDNGRYGFIKALSMLCFDHDLSCSNLAALDLRVDRMFFIR